MRNVLALAVFGLLIGACSRPPAPVSSPQATSAALPPQSSLPAGGSSEQPAAAPIGGGGLSSASQPAPPPVQTGPAGAGYQAPIDREQFQQRLAERRKLRLSQAGDGVPKGRPKPNASQPVMAAVAELPPPAGAGPVLWSGPPDQLPEKLRNRPDLLYQSTDTGSQILLKVFAPAP